MTQREIFQRMLPYFMNRSRVNQVELATRLGVSKSTVNCWVSGKSFPRIDKIQQIADILGCSTDDLLSKSIVYTATAEDLRSTDRLTDEERMLVVAYREAKPAYQALAMELLMEHKKEESK